MLAVAHSAGRFARKAVALAKGLAIGAGFMLIVWAFWPLAVIIAAVWFGYICLEGQRAANDSVLNSVFRK